MSQPCCPSPINPCVDPASPTTNYSSEASDVFFFFGRNYPGPPFLDGGGHEPGPPTIENGDGGVPIPPNLPRSPCAQGPNAGTAFGVSEISQEWATIEANNVMVDCIDVTPADAPPNQSPKLDQEPPVNPPTIEDGSGGGGSPPRQPRKVCNNAIEICEVPCGPYGTFKYQIGQNKVCAFTQEQANEMAHSMACQLALQNRICLPQLSPIAWCVDNNYDAIIDSKIDGATLGLAALKPGQTGVPPGIGFHNASESGGDKRAGFLNGTPSTVGEWCFEMVAVIANLLASQRTYCILIFDIECDLEGATAGQDYSDTMHILGPVSRTKNPKWTILEGSLPPGLSLNTDTGEISGHVPVETAADTYEFTVEVCFDATIQGQTENRCCTKTCSIMVGEAVCPDWTLLDWGPFVTDLHGAGTVANGTTNENQANITASTPGGPGPEEFFGVASFANDFVYDGPGCEARLRLNLVINDPAVAQVTITEGTNTIFDTSAIGATGNYTFDFTMPPSAMVTYHIFFGVSVGSIGTGPPWEPGSINAVATLEWQ